MILWNQSYTTKLWRKSLGFGGIALTLLACGEASEIDAESPGSDDIKGALQESAAPDNLAEIVNDKSFPEYDRSVRAERIAALGLDRGLGAEAFKVCAGCHGLDGLGSRDGVVPRLAGQHREVILHRLIEISDGVRTREEMTAYKPAIATDAQIGALAVYIEALADPAEVRFGSSNGLDVAEDQYSELCASCHGANGEGDGPAGIPRIGGWDYASVEQSLSQLQAPDAEVHETGMSDLVSMLTKDDTSALADYVSRLVVTEN